MPDLADWSQSVSIDAASVTIPVSGSVSITSGSVTIANASIAVINASGTKITSARPPVQLLSAAVVAGNTASGTTSGLSPDCQAIVVTFAFPVANYAHFKLAWHAGGANSWIPFELFSFAQQVYAFPITPGSTDHAGVLQTQLDYTIQATAVGNAQIEIWELFESAPLWLQVFPLPQSNPNQFPKTAILTLAALVAQWVIQSVANVQITLFNIVVMRYNPSVANDDFVLGYNATLPTNGNPVPNAQVLVDSTQTAASGTGPMFTIPLAGVQLPRGAGLFADTSLSGVANLWLLVEYSLS